LHISSGKPKYHQILKAQITPTKKNFFKTEKIDDIIDHSFRDADDENCYLPSATEKME
jgi:hypothetical protein